MTGNVSVLPCNKEKYISFSHSFDNDIIKYRYIDSMRFLGTSLDNLISTISEDDFKILKTEFNNLKKKNKPFNTKRGLLV